MKSTYIRCLFAFVLVECFATVPSLWNFPQALHLNRNFKSLWDGFKSTTSQDFSVS